MKAQIYKILSMKHFFTVLQFGDNSVKFMLKQPSQMLIKNIHKNWLQYIRAKTHKMPVYVNESYKELEHLPSVFGIIKQNVHNYENDTILEVHFNNCAQVNKSDLRYLYKSELELNLFVPQIDAMQYFIQWQRLRKYWWSTISTSPSLFSINEYKYEHKTAKVDIVAQLPSGQQPVERVIMTQYDENETRNCLSCAICLEDALFILLLDGITNSTSDEYLRLHRKIAPYKVSFALDLKEKSSQREHLVKIARLLHHKLESVKITTLLPDFSLPFEVQIKENLRMGVTYTAVLDENTPKYGIFKILNSSTMLTEQFHVTDFNKFAALLFEY